MAGERLPSVLRFARDNGRVTVPVPPDSPGSRRAARALREEADRRAREQAQSVAPADVDLPDFLLPADPTGPVASPLTATTRPAALPGDFALTPAAPAPNMRPAEPQLRPRVGRSRRKPEVSERRAARAEQLLLTAEEGDDGPARHARPRRLAKAGVVAAIAVGGVLLLGSTAAVTALVAGGQPSGASSSATTMTAVLPETVEELPVPKVEQSPATTDICASDQVMTALEAHDDGAAIEAAGGGEAFRNAVASGDAPCVDLSDPARVWAVINKARPYAPIDYRPAGLVMPDGVRSLEGGSLRRNAASALTAMATAARAAGVGEIALESGFRSYETQQGSYGRQVDERGTDGADLVSARPGFSEHQSGLAGDVVACAGGCGTLDDLAATAQGEWIKAHAWEYGWIVRYVDGATDVTGYLPEPWHLRYIGRDLARAYHDGGWTSLEQFFGLGPAPDYIN